MWFGSWRLRVAASELDATWTAGDRVECGVQGAQAMARTGPAAAEQSPGS